MTVPSHTHIYLADTARCTLPSPRTPFSSPCNLRGARHLHMAYLDVARSCCIRVPCCPGCAQSDASFCAPSFCAPSFIGLDLGLPAEGGLGARIGRAHV